MGLPEESITTKKREHMIACAEHYAMENEIDRWQIDVISIEGKPGIEPIITYFENAI
jgi:Holliday junction resolvase-like predicted endonuclease